MTENKYRVWWQQSGMTQKAWAEKLGVSRWTVLRWVKGEFNPSHLHREKIEKKMKRMAR